MRQGLGKVRNNAKIEFIYVFKKTSNTIIRWNSGAKIEMLFRRTTVQFKVRRKFGTIE
jgi:hypothetical protein